MKIIANHYHQKVNEAEVNRLVDRHVGFVARISTDGIMYGIELDRPASQR